MKTTTPVGTEIHNLLADALRWRYAVKKFDANQKIGEEDLYGVLQATQLSPSSMGLQPYTFKHIKDEVLRETLAANTSNQTQMRTASDIVVFAAKTAITETEVDEFVRLGATLRGYSPEAIDKRINMMNGFIAGFKNDALFQWATNQAYLAMGQMLTSAAILRIDTCPMEGIDTAAFDRILDMKSLNLRTLAVVALGYRASDDALSTQPKVRKPIDQLFEII